MSCHEIKCGIGTASRNTMVGDRKYMLGALVQANYGTRETLRIAGVPVGQDIPVSDSGSATAPHGDSGSIIVVLATDAPLLPTQLKRVAKRASLALGRMGSFAGNGSGDMFVAFSTANAAAFNGRPLVELESLGNDYLDPVFIAAVQATEEAIVNAMVAARDMRGQDGHFTPALPHDRLVELLKRYGRYTPPP
jgi:D-aminopeptidase